MILNEGEHSIKHYGTPRHSGRYPWGSGADGEMAPSHRSFLDHVYALEKQGVSPANIAKGMGMSTTDLRAKKSIAKAEIKAEEIARARRLRDEHGYSNVKIGELMGKNESSVRALLAEGQAEKANSLQSIASMLKDNVDRKQMVDVGAGVEHYLGVSKEKLGTAISILKEQGYTVQKVDIEQLGTGQMTTHKVLVPPGMTQRDVWMNRGGIKQIDQIREYSDDGGRSFTGIDTPLSISSSRVKVRYKEEGGDTADGVIYVRPGKDDISLGKNQYAQVRIAVDGTHYLKGMAIYKDDLPKGVDLVFNTNKAKADIGTDPHAAMKKMKDDPNNPFGAVVRQIKSAPDADGKRHVTSVMNLVNEEGDWERWSRNLSSQMLSKQSHTLAQEQLGKAFEKKKAQFDEIMALTNPSVKKKLLETFADEADSASVHLKAAAMKGQATHVIIPVNGLKDHEVYAPNYNSGDKVVLVRYPHGGKFEIPELTVNNNHREAKKLLGNAPDAIGINSHVAGRLSGADFDGDTVLVIPNNHRKVKTAPPLEGLKNFDPQTEYKGYTGMKTIDGGVYNAETRKVDYGGKQPSGREKGIQMGYVSNLITDMTIKGASSAELARAVRHSMVVIDAEKHSLDYKRSHRENAIGALMLKYQDKTGGGASTLISRSGSETRIPDRKLRPAGVKNAKGESGPINPRTGEKEWVETGRMVVDKNGKTVPKMIAVDKLALAKDAHKLSSGTQIEHVYAEYSNQMKALANTGRKASLGVKTIPYSPAAKKAYAPEVASLNAALSLAYKNKPLERQAQLVANAHVAMTKKANPEMEKSEIKKLKSMALDEARRRMGAEKQRIIISDREWEAIQAGAITHTRLDEILKNADIDRVKDLATPRKKPVMNTAKLSQAKRMLAAGRTQAEVAGALGVSLTTLKTTLKEGVE